MLKLNNNVILGGVMKRIIFIVLFLIFVNGLFGDALSIVKKVDKMYRYNSTHAIIEMNIITPNWERTMEMEIWTKGVDKTFIKILKPAKEKGITTLRIGKDMWNYLPKTDKVIKIPPSMMMASWMGSDFTNDDLVKEFTFEKDYIFEIAEENDSIVIVKCNPRPDLPVIWSYIKVGVRKKDTIPIYENFYDEDNNIIREMLFKDIKIFQGVKLPSVLELIPMNKEGHKTVIKYKNLEFNKRISDKIFSLKNLKKAG